jgi:putative radical SAM enzyme (TIGR03279 family)
MNILSVEPDSPASVTGIEPGDRLLRINDQPVADTIDYMFHAGGDTHLSLDLEREDGTPYTVKVMKEPDGRLGLSFEGMKIKTCDNTCIFCFLHQNPRERKLRRSLYLQDDDYRLSFLHGAYVTLTNLTEADVRRIIAQHLSPLYVSVHATDPVLRGNILGRDGPDDVLARMRRLIDGGIAMHCQVVLCPGINDGPHLDRTINDLADLYPDVPSVAVVPVGLTDHRKRLTPIRPIGPADAQTCIRQVDRWGQRFRKALGTRFVYAADEFYLMLDRDVPGRRYYDDFPQVENGVGMVRRFLDTFGRQERTLPSYISPPRHVTLVTGKLGERFLPEVVRRLNERRGLTVELLAVENRLFGKGITVSGLLSGSDIQDALNAQEASGVVLLPPNCVNTEGRFLDDLTVAEVAEGVSRPVIIGEYDIVKSLKGVVSGQVSAISSQQEQ